MPESPLTGLPSKSALQRLGEADPLLGQAMKRLAPFPGFPTRESAAESPFQALARSICHQQLAGAAAQAIHGRARALTPGPGFPDPKECLSLGDEPFRTCGLSRAKTRAILDLARRVCAGDVRLDQVESMTDARIARMLVRAWGVGEWTAHMFLIFRLGRLDVMPIGDLGVREGIRILDGLQERPAPREALERARVWRPLRSVATWFLYRLVEERRRAQPARSG